MPTIDILMATYNGAEYVETQIESILKQDFPFSKLIIRDDLSTDNTPKLLQIYADKYPNKITVLPVTKRLGVKKNFSCLLETSTADYALCADQDDYWLPNKVRETFVCMQQLEKKFGKALPLLVHTDLVVVDENLKEISPSFWNYMHIFPQNSQTLNRLLVQNVVTGCTMMLNRALIDITTPIPGETFMHDWWIALVAASFGQIAALDKSTMLYRQHRKNTLGAQKFSSIPWFVNALKKVFNKQPQLRNQTQELFSRYEKQLSLVQKDMLVDYIHLSNKSFLKKRRLVISHKFYKNGFLRNCAQLIYPS